MSRSRSPNYPILSLEEAIERAKILYSKDYTNTMSREVIAEHLGYNGLNGSSLRVVSALRHYHLLEDSNDGLKLSNEAITILVDPIDSPDRREAVRKVALAPILFVELNEKYPDSLPSEGNLRAYLQKNGFTPKAAIAAAQVYKDTMEFMAREGEEEDSSETINQSLSLNPSTISSRGVGGSEPNPLGGETRFLNFSSGPVVIFPLPRGNVIEIRLKTKVLPGEFEHLKQVFELLRFSIVEEES